MTIDSTCADMHGASSLFGGEERCDELALSLYRLARAEAASDFQDRCFAALQAQVPFDSGFWSHVVQEDGRVHLVSNWRFQLPPEVEGIWAGLEERDVVGRLAFTTPGRTVNIVARRLIHDPELVERIIEAFGLEYVLSTCLLDPLTSMFHSVTLFRGAGGPAFTEGERRFVEGVTPHLVEALGVNRLIHLLETQQSTGIANYATAACDGDALLYVARPQFLDMLRLEWADWHGARLPQALREDLRRGRAFTYRGRAVVVRCTPVHELLWLRARPKAPVDDLAPRELEVARLSADGRTNKVIARALGISPFTVRNQLTSIYDKLGITGRTELAALLAATD